MGKMIQGRITRLALPVSVTLVVILCLASAVQSAVVKVSADQSLQLAINRAADSDTLILQRGTFRVRKTAFIDSLCGNCQNHQTIVPATYGFHISNKSLTIIGAGQSATKLVTRAGYGVWITDAPKVTLANLAITGGARDSSGDATNAGIVVRNSRVEVRNVTVRDNERTDTTVVVGIGGIFGREGAELFVSNCELLNNSWDGIALYRGATADVRDTKISGGRGAGIGVTWDAACVAVRNEITGYWKGIGSFGASRVIAKNNLIHHNLGWGMVATGDSYMDFTNNVVFSNGNCGVAPWSVSARGRIANNIITANGWRKQWVCPCVGVWNNGDWAKWEFTNNIVWDNVDGDYRDIFDQSKLGGNLNVDPGFSDTLSFQLQPGSPARDAGSEKITDRDGSASDIGLYGGPQAVQESK